MKIADRAECIRAAQRAKAALKPGDKLSVTRCGGLTISVVFTGWDGSWGCSAKHNDLAPRSIVKLNGKHVSFRDPPWEHFDPNTGRPFGDHGTAEQANEFILGSPQAPGEETEFLRAWRDGSAWEEWPEFYDWLLDQEHPRAVHQQRPEPFPDDDEAPF